MKSLQILRGGVFAVVCLMALAVGYAQNPSVSVAPPPTPPPPPPPPQPAAFAPAADVTRGARVGRGAFNSGNDSVPADYHGDTAEARLLKLQGDLKKTLDGLHQIPASQQSGFVATVIAEYTRAQADTGYALDFVKAHPEVNPLPAIPARAGMPGLRFLSGFAYLNRSEFQTAYPALPTAVDIMDASLLNLIDGPYPGTSAIVGDLGGYRDKIMRNISQATTDIIAGATAIGRGNTPVRGRRGTPAQVAANPPATGQPNPPPPPPAPSGPPQLSGPTLALIAGANASAAKPGSVSGIVADEDGLAANVLITVQLADNNNTRPLPANAIRNGGTPMTISDDQGAFTVKDLPPGRYYINISRTFTSGYGQAASTQAIDVKEGAETTLPAPIRMQASPF